MGVNNPALPLPSGDVTLLLAIQTNSAKHVNYLNIIPKDSQITLNRLEAMFQQFLTGAFQSNILVTTNAGYASQTATLAGVVATDTIVIGGTTLTAVAANPTNAQFLVGANNNATAANLAAAINANTTLKTYIFASAAANVVTIFCMIPGLIGNAIQLSQTGGHITLGASALAGATAGTTGLNSHGI